MAVLAIPRARILIMASACLALSLTGCATIADTESSVLASSCSERLAASSEEFAVIAIDEDGREVPFTVFLPAQPGTYPLMGFSHGAFASPTRYRAMLAPIAAAGYIVVAPMHIDSEEFGAEERPSPEDTWRTRNFDMALALDPPEQIQTALNEKGFAIDADRLASAGHSYGAIMAQLPGGAMAVEPVGPQVDRTNVAVNVVVGWSPPGEVPGMISAEGWRTLDTPTLTITGTTDILPGFIDDWRAHKASYDNAPEGARAVWVGEGIDHYFGGMFGREKPADANSQRLFNRALAVSLNFMDRHVGRDDVCALDPTEAGEDFKED